MTHQFYHNGRIYDTHGSKRIATGPRRSVHIDTSPELQVKTYYLTEDGVCFYVMHRTELEGWLFKRIVVLEPRFHVFRNKSDAAFDIQNELGEDGILAIRKFLML